VWKSLHLLVYLAYGLVVAHVALGALQAERHPFLLAVFGAGVLWILGLHLVAGWRERSGDRERVRSDADAWVLVCGVDEIGEKRARVVTLGGERVAVFRYDGKLSAISNLCQHQNGPLGEGRIIDGCVTCPWHGYQYRPEDGRSPPPFEERVATYRVKLEESRVLVDPRALPRGTRVEPASIGAPNSAVVP
jgi:nitrite reductase/ring-hydroxylating ferredoxin subunit